MAIFGVPRNGGALSVYALKPGPVVFCYHLAEEMDCPLAAKDSQ